MSDDVFDDASSSQGITHHDDDDDDDDDDDGEDTGGDDDDDDDDDDDVFPTSMRLPRWSRRCAGFGLARSRAEAAVIAAAIFFVVAVAGTSTVNESPIY